LKAWCTPNKVFLFINWLYNWLYKVFAIVMNRCLVHYLSSVCLSIYEINNKHPARGWEKTWLLTWKINLEKVLSFP
jgi:hypothetical protein